MSNEKLPIKLFAPREIDELRVEGGSNSKTPNWVLKGEELIQKSEFLSNSLKKFKNKIMEKDKKSAIPFVFIAKIKEDSSAKSRRTKISSLFQFREQNNIIGLKDDDKLLVKIDTITQIKKILERLKDYNNNNYAISCLENFLDFEPNIILKNEEIVYKIKLIDYQDYEQNLVIQRIFERTLKRRGIKYKKTDYSEQLPIYKVKADIDSLKVEDVFEALFSIEPMPKYFPILDFLPNENEIEIIKPQEGKEYITVGILDNGIADIPHLKPWMAGKWSVYPEEYINPTHGTFVAGIALYGDICEQKNWVGHQGIKIFDATIFPSAEEGIDEDQLIENIKEAVSENHQKIKIWNLSISVNKPISDENFSDFAIALDYLQDKYNILICKSAGNCSNFINNLPKGRINEGADSVRSLVVGSIAHSKGKYDIAEMDNPSPFSRIGPGPEYIIKPEISHYGGNAGIDAFGNLKTSGVKSFSKEGVLSSSIGTSFSTPRITSLAAGLYQELNEEFDPLLLKALIVHSASYPKNLKVPVTERTKQLGFGIPKTVHDIIYNSAHEVTLILRENLTKGQYIDIMDFPVPPCLIQNGFFTGQIIITLVYEPILDSTQGAEYCQSDIDIKFGSYDSKFERDISKRNILNPIGRKGTKNLLSSDLYSKTKMKENFDEFALRERLLIQYGDKYYPVKKYAVDLSEFTEGNKMKYLSKDKKWYRDYLEKKITTESLSQEICVIITIRDPNKKENVYDGVAQKLDEFNFWHTNIKITSDVDISV